jgi:hypothetical protein
VSELEKAQALLEECVNALGEELAAMAEGRRIAALIRAQKAPCPEQYHGQFPRPSCWQCGRNGAFERAARIALDGTVTASTSCRPTSQRPEPSPG